MPGDHRQIIFIGLRHHLILLQVGPYSSHGHSSSSNMYTPIQPLNGLNGAKSTCGSNGQHSVASLQMVWDDQRMIGEVIKSFDRRSDQKRVIKSFSARMKRRPGGAKMSYRRLTAAVLPVIEKDLKLVCQESARLVVRFHSRGSFNICRWHFYYSAEIEHQEILDCWKDQICKYGSTNMQSQLLVIILMTMKAVKILIQF